MRPNRIALWLAASTLLLAACGGKDAPPALAVSAGTVSLGGTLGTALLVRPLEASGNTPAEATTITITPPASDAVSLTCAAHSDACYFELPSLSPPDGSWTASATIGGQTATTTFTRSHSTLAGAQQIVAKTSDTVVGSTVTVSWQAVPKAVTYLAQLFDVQSGQAISDAASTSQPQATLTTTTAMFPDGNYGVQVVAFSVDPNGASFADPLPVPLESANLGYLANLPGSRWALYAPADYVGDTLTITTQNLGPTEQLAVIPINVGGSDNVFPTVTLAVSGTSVFSRTAAPAPSAQAQPSPEFLLEVQALRGHERLRAREQGYVKQLAELRQRGLFVEPALRRSASVQAAAATPTTFCVQQGIDQDAPYVRKSATPVAETAHAIFFVDDDDAAEYAQSDWADLAQYWEGNGATPGIYTLDTGAFGAESDVDGNGKLIVFLTHELGAATGGAITLGYFTANDTIATAADTSTGCTSNGSNHADMFYLNSLGNVQAAGYSDPVHTNFPDTLAHEFQHLISFNQHHLVHHQIGFEDTWINEGLSVTAEDLCGFGWNGSLGRSAGSQYLAYYEPSQNLPYLRYFNTSLPNWEGDPIGDYEGAHAFIRYFTDRLGTPFLGAMDQSSQVGIAHLAAVLNESYPRALAEWATALLFSGESFAPDQRFNFATSVPWSPLHSSLCSGEDLRDGYQGHDGHLGYRTLDPSSDQDASLRFDGWNAFVTGNGTGADSTLTVTSRNGNHPYVVVARFSGALPEGDGQVSCP